MKVALFLFFVSNQFLQYFAVFPFEGLHDPARLTYWLSTREKKEDMMNGRRIVTSAILSLLIGVGGCTKYKDKIANQGDEISSLRIDKAELEAAKDDLE